MKTLTELKTAIMTKKSYKILGKEVFVLRNRIKYANDLNTSESEVLEIANEIKYIKDFIAKNCEVINVEYFIGNKVYYTKAFEIENTAFKGFGEITSYYRPRIVAEITQEMILKQNSEINVP